MSLRNFITEKIILPGTDILLKKDIAKQLNFLIKSQYWSEDDLIAFQNRKLQELINHAYKNVPYYYELFNELNLKPSDFQKKNDLKKLPILTKEKIRLNIKNGKLLAKNINQKDFIYNSSSGSTGEPLQFYLSKSADSMKKASAIRGWNWMGYKLGDKFIKVSQIPRKGRLKKIQDSIIRSYYLFIPQLDDNHFHKIVESLIHYKPSVLRCYPDPLRFLSVYIKKNKIKLSGIKSINTTGSILTPETRELAENVFQCKIYDSFSCEGGAVVYECESNENYHSAMEYAITEIVDENNKDVTLGRLVTTDLWNYAMPFIRYDTQDIIEISDKQCSCGRKLLPIKKIYGRESDILITPSGQFLIANNFTGFFQWIKEVEQFQVKQTELNKFEFYLKVNENYSKQIELKIIEYYKNVISSDVQIHINVVDDIPLTKSGKRRFLIRNDHIPLPV